MEQLKKWKAKHDGHLKIPLNDKVLGEFVKNIRMKYSKKTLLQEHFEQLDATGFIWEAKLKQLAPDKLADDYNESLVLTNPTFLKWNNIPAGKTLEYSHGRYMKGNELDDIRLWKAMFFITII